MKEMEVYAAGFCPYCRNLVLYSNKKICDSLWETNPLYIEMLDREMREQLKKQVEQQQCPKGHGNVIILVMNAPTRVNLDARLKELGEILYNFLTFTDGRWNSEKTT